MTLPKLLITGCDGLVGRILWPTLGDEYDLYGLDMQAEEKGGHKFRTDITHFEQVQAVFDQIPSLSFVIHLAGDPRVEADWPSVLANNIVGSENIYEAARRHGVRRILFASSNHVTGAYEGFPPRLHSQTDPAQISVRDPIRPDGFYGAGKAAVEALARMYHEVYGLESICLRIGSVIAEDDPGSNPRLQSTWLSHRDLVQLIRKSLTAGVGFGIYYGVSNNRKRFWDISNAETDLDYRPEDDAAVRIRSGRKEDMQ